MRVGQMQARPVETLICVPAGPNVYIPSEYKQPPPKNLRTPSSNLQREAGRLGTCPKCPGYMGHQLIKGGGGRVRRHALVCDLEEGLQEEALSLGLSGL